HRHARRRPRGYAPHTHRAHRGARQDPSHGQDVPAPGRRTEAGATRCAEGRKKAVTASQTELSAVERVLGADGPIARALGAGYEPRQQQLVMARAVAEAMETRSHLLVEAGTGVGKSFAYLAPAILRVLR